MRIFLISLLSMVFLSGCEEKGEGFIGKWNSIVLPQKGIVIQKNGTGFSFDARENRSSQIGSFTWTLKEDSEGAFLEANYLESDFARKIRFDGSYLKYGQNSEGKYFGRLERAK